MDNSMDMEKTITEGNKMVFGLKPELPYAIEEATRKVIDEKIDLKKIAKEVAGEKLKEYSGMNEYQVKMLTFAEKMVDVLKAKLGDSIGDAASAKIVEMLSWEMKAQRDNNY